MDWSLYLCCIFEEFFENSILPIAPEPNFGAESRVHYEDHTSQMATVSHTASQSGHPELVHQCGILYLTHGSRDQANY